MPIRKVRTEFLKLEFPSLPSRHSFLISTQLLSQFQNLDVELMAFRRSIMAKTKLFYQQKLRVSPSFSYIDNRDAEEMHTNSISKNSEIRSYFNNRFLMTRNYSSNSLLSRNVFQLRRSEIPVGCGVVPHRYMSSESVGGRVDYDIDTEVLNSVVLDKVAEAAPLVNEVAVAAADSAPAVAALQHLIDHVHCYTGFNWWASIVVTTILIRLVQLPVYIEAKKFLPKILTVMAPYFRGPSVALYSNVFKSEIPQKMKFSERYAGIIFFGSVSCMAIELGLVLAILNMVKKVPSFTNGGTLWFTDLTASDRICFPILLALTYWTENKVNATKNRVPVWEGVMVLLAASVGFYPAIHCYLITTNLFTIPISIAFSKPQVQKLLGLPSTDKRAR